MNVRELLQELGYYPPEAPISFAFDNSIPGKIEKYNNGDITILPSKVGNDHTVGLLIQKIQAANPDLDGEVQVGRLCYLYTLRYKTGKVYINALAR